MNIEQYRGKNYVLKVDTQEQWDSVIPKLRQDNSNPFTKEEFNNYNNIVIYLHLFNAEYMGDLANINLKKYTIINFPNQIIELW